MSHNKAVIFRTLLIIFVLTSSVIVYFLSTNNQKKIAFFYNQRVFDEFTGKIALEGNLEELRKKNKRTLDSIASLVGSGDKELMSVYRQKSDLFSIQEQQLSDKYSSDIWKHINDAVSEFGKENGYDYIFGATGNGSLMYADETNDITEEVVSYLNQEYGKR